MVAQTSRPGHQGLSTSFQAGLGDEKNGNRSGSSLGFLVLVVNVTAQQASAAADSRADSWGPGGQADKRSPGRAHRPAAQYPLFGGRHAGAAAKYQSYNHNCQGLSHFTLPLSAATAAVVVAS